MDKSLNESAESSVRYAARIICPLCSNIISVSCANGQPSSGHSNDLKWNTARFDDHIKTHQNDPYFENKENCEYCSLSKKAALKIII